MLALSEIIICHVRKKGRGEAGFNKQWKVQGKVKGDLFLSVDQTVLHRSEDCWTSMITEPTGGNIEI